MWKHEGKLRKSRILAISRILVILEKAVQESGGGQTAGRWRGTGSHKTEGPQVEFGSLRKGDKPEREAVENKIIFKGKRSVKSNTLQFKGRLVSILT